MYSSRVINQSAGSLSELYHAKISNNDFARNKRRSIPSRSRSQRHSGGPGAAHPSLLAGPRLEQGGCGSHLRHPNHRGFSRGVDPFRRQRPHISHLPLSRGYPSRLSIQHPLREHHFEQSELNRVCDCVPPSSKANHRRQGQLHRHGPIPTCPLPGLSVQELLHVSRV